MPSSPDPDPTATELAPPQTRAECVAWLRARAKKKFDEADAVYYANFALSTRLKLMGIALSDAAADLERGEQP